MLIHCASGPSRVLLDNGAIHTQLLIVIPVVRSQRFSLLRQWYAFACVHACIHACRFMRVCVHAYMCACLYACVVRVHVGVCLCVRLRQSALSRLAVEVAAICPANLVHARNYTALGGREDVLHRFTRGGEHRGSDEDVHVRQERRWRAAPAERFSERG